MPGIRSNTHDSAISERDEVSSGELSADGDTTDSVFPLPAFCDSTDSVSSLSPFSDEFIPIVWESETAASVSSDGMCSDIPESASFESRCSEETCLGQTCPHIPDNVGVIGDRRTRRNAAAPNDTVLPIVDEVDRRTKIVDDQIHDFIEVLAMPQFGMSYETLRIKFFEAYVDKRFFIVTEKSLKIPSERLSEFVREKFVTDRAKKEFQEQCQKHMLTIVDDYVKQYSLLFSL